MSTKPLPGSDAPDFTATALHGETGEEFSLTLSQLKGKPVLLYFYPKDDTPGCTKQACALRDSWADLTDKVVVLGVSADPVASHKKFRTKYSLPFTLVSDPEKTIIVAYGVWVEKSMYGKKYMGIERSSFLIDADGKVKAVFEKVSPGDHLGLVQKALKE
jgi:thioredoxin-dependent peroxiredoxin